MDHPFEHEDFARRWDRFAGSDGDAYKREVIDPALLRLAGPIAGAATVELGCGNGALARKLLDAGARELTLLDISEANLRHARLRLGPAGARVSCLRQDVTRPWSLPAACADRVVSSFLFNEVGDLRLPFAEARRILRPGGTMILAVAHPAWALWELAREHAGAASTVFAGLRGYFERSAGCVFLPDPASGAPIELPYFHRPIGDYLRALSEAGFGLEAIEEPELSPALRAESVSAGAAHLHPIGRLIRARALAGAGASA